MKDVLVEVDRMQQKGNSDSGSYREKGHLENEINRLGPRALEIFEMLVLSKEGLTAEEVRKNGVKISKATISSHLSTLRNFGLAVSVDEQKESKLWTKRYFIDEKVTATIDVLFLSIIIDHPGIYTDLIFEMVPFSLKFIISRLNALKEKGSITVTMLDRYDPPLEKWYSTVEDA